MGLWVLIKKNRWANYQEWLTDLEAVITDPATTRQELIKAIREARALQRQWPKSWASFASRSTLTVRQSGTLSRA
jgi:hypothetical protein